MKSAAEEIIRQFNSSVFLKEFTFFPKEIPKSKGKRELSDGLIWLGDSAIFFQTKERGETQKVPSEKKQITWFDKNILGVAVRQMMGSLRTFESKREVDFLNLGKQLRKIKYSTLKIKHYVVLHHSNPYPFPRECHARKSLTVKTSRRFVHIMSAIDWIHLCRYLYTPVEIMEYLEFRKKYLRYILDTRMESERWLLGRFLASPIVPSMKFDAEPQDFEKWVDDLENKAAEAPSFNNIAQTLASYKNRTPEINDYHKTMLYLALLNRIDRGLFVERYNLMGRKVLDRSAACVYRFTSPQNDIGFVFSFAYPDFSLEQRLNSLMHFTYAHKYEQKVQRCIGLCIYPSAENDLLVDWYFTESRWEKSSEWDNVVKDLYERDIFLSVKKETVPRYTFEDKL